MSPRKVIVFDAEEEPIVEFSRADAEKRLLFPSFWDYRKRFGIRMDDGLNHDFDISPKGMAIVKTYLEDAILAGGPRRVKTVLDWGILLVIVGSSAAALAVLGTVVSYQAAAAQPAGGRYFVALGVFLAGLALLSKGIFSIVRYKKLCRKIKELSDSKKKAQDDE